MKVKYMSKPPDLDTLLKKRDRLNAQIADELNKMFKPGDEITWRRGIRGNVRGSTLPYHGTVNSILVHNCAPYLIVSNKRRKWPFKVPYMPGNTRITRRAE